MAYTIGIDVGTSYTAAAIARGGHGEYADPEPVALGSRSSATASVVFVGDIGQLLVGDSAERRAATHPDRVVREFKRRLGDSVPLVVGGQGHRPETIAARVVRWVVDRVTEREGAAADAIAVTHPAGWGPYKLSLLSDALARVGLSDVTLLSEPAAAAAHYASRARIQPGSTVAVYDLGGGTFDAAVVRKTDDESFEVLGTPQGIERLGGVDFDEAVFGHLCAGVAMPTLDPSDPDVLAAVARVRRDCTEAKEALSSDTEVTIPLLLPGLQTRVRMVRSEFEGMVRDSLEDTVDALRRAVESAGIREGDVDSVLLVGGSSRIPLVAQLVSAEFGRPIAVDADPKASISLGAARLATARVPGLVGASKRMPGGAENGSTWTSTWTSASNGTWRGGENGTRHGRWSGAVSRSAANSPSGWADEGEEATQPIPVIDLHAGPVGVTKGGPRRRRTRRVPTIAVLVLLAIMVTAGAAFATRLSLEPEPRSAPVPSSTPGVPTSGDGNPPGATSPPAVESTAVDPGASAGGTTSTSGAAGSGGRQASLPETQALMRGQQSTWSRAAGSTSGGRTGESVQAGLGIADTAATVDAVASTGSEPGLVQGVTSPAEPPAPTAPLEPPVEPAAEPSPAPSAESPTTTAAPQPPGSDTGEPTAP